MCRLFGVIAFPFDFFSVDELFPLILATNFISLNSIQYDIRLLFNYEIHNSGILFSLINLITIEHTRWQLCYFTGLFLTVIDCE